MFIAGIYSPSGFSQVLLIPGNFNGYAPINFIETDATNCIP